VTWPSANSDGERTSTRSAPPATSVLARAPVIFSTAGAAAADAAEPEVDAAFPGSEAPWQPAAVVTRRRGRMALMVVRDIIEQEGFARRKKRA
jgi:hypothetical protein